MRGEYNAKVDAKGRLIFPAKLREEIGDSFVIFRGLDNCINAYSLPMWEEFEQKIAALPSSARKAKRFFSANFLCEPDAQGRILIPQTLREYAALQKDAVVMGMIDHVEIWDSAMWEKYQTSTDPEEVAEIMEMVGM